VGLVALCRRRWVLRAPALTYTAFAAISYACQTLSHTTQLTDGPASDPE